MSILHLHLGDHELARALVDECPYGLGERGLEHPEIAAKPGECSARNQLAACLNALKGAEYFSSRYSRFAGSSRASRAGSEFSDMSASFT